MIRRSEDLNEKSAWCMTDNTENNISTEERKCVVCGKAFVPNSQDDDCCSPFCRTMKRAMDFETCRKNEETERKAALDAMSRPPKFNLVEHPKARAEWFMSLPDEYKVKFRKFLSPQELEWARAIAQKTLADDRFFSGIYVKNGKVMGSKSSENDDGDDEGDAREQDDEANDGDDYYED